MEGKNMSQNDVFFILNFTSHIISLFYTWCYTLCFGRCFNHNYRQLINVTSYQLYPPCWSFWQFINFSWFQSLNICPTVECMLAVNLSHSQGHSVHYILVGDNSKRVYVIHEGTIVMVIPTPADVTAVRNVSCIK